MKKVRVLTALILVAAMMTGMAAPAAAETFVSVQKGFGGDVTVEADISDGIVTAVRVEGKEETAGIGSRAIEQLPTVIEAAGNADVEGVSGATFTSTAIIEGVKDAMRQSAGEEVGEMNFVPGTYTAEAKGHNGFIAVEVVVSEHAIESVKMTGTRPDTNPLIDPENVRAAKALALQNDQPNCLATIETQLPERIVAAQSVAVDAIAGATASSHGLLAAVKDCLLQAGGDPATFSKPVAKTDAVEVYDCDVVVVGGGSSGSLAASRAAAEGAKVIIVEKSGRLGGTGALSSTPFSVGADIQKDTGYEYDTDLFYEQWQSQVHWSAKGNLIRKFVRESGDTINFMSANGFEFVPVKQIATVKEGAYGTHFSDAAFTHFGVKYAESNHYKTMTIDTSFNTLCKDVDTILFETTGKSLIVDESGKVCGVMAERYDGTTVQVNAKAVIVSTGGYAGNEELMKRFNNGYVYKVLGLQQNVGEGLEMMLAAGAGLRSPGGTCAHQSGVYALVEGEGISKIDQAITYTVANAAVIMRVSPTGARFMDENEKVDSAVSSTNYMVENGSYYWALLDQNMVDVLRTQGLAGLGQTETPPDSYMIAPMPGDMAMENIDLVMECGQKQGLIFKADTLEELAEITGMDPRTLTVNVERYNQWCEEGKDGDYCKDPAYMYAYGAGPYYAVQACPLIYNSLGGVNIDEFMRVLDVNEKVIPGLYSTGADSIGAVLDGVAYVDLRGICLGWAFTSGKVAGREAAQYVK